MPTSFHHQANGLSINGNSLNSSNLVEIDNQDPSKLFIELTEIGHGNFGAVYYVI
jgi:hypothetical protein